MHNSYLYFSFYADTFDPEVVTRQLGIKPTKITFKKQPAPIETSWDYKIEAGNGHDLKVPLEELLNIFVPKIKDINRLKIQLQLKTILIFVVDIDINQKAITPYFGLNKRAIDFLSKTETEVSYDLYKS